MKTGFIQRTYFAFIFLLVAIFSPSGIGAQVVPGKAYGEIKMGSSRAKVESVLGDPSAVYTAKEQAANYKDSGYDPKKELPFFLKFDQALDYYGSERDNPVFTVFLKNDAVMYITLSSYVTTEGISRATGTPEAVHLLDAPAVMESAYGKNKLERGEDGQTEWYYLQKGIGANLEENEIRVFYLFPPMTEKAATKFEKICNKK